MTVTVWPIARFEACTCAGYKFAGGETDSRPSLGVQSSCLQLSWFELRENCLKRTAKLLRRRSCSCPKLCAPDRRPLDRTCLRALTGRPALPICTGCDSLAAFLLPFQQVHQCKSHLVPRHLCGRHPKSPKPQLSRSDEGLIRGGLGSKY